MNWEYRKALILSGIPVTGCYRFNDTFQILPADPEAPRPPAVLNHHPFVIEYRFVVDDTVRQLPGGEKIPQWIINNDEASKSLKEILLLLTTFSCDRLFTYSHKQSWFIPMGIEKGNCLSKKVQWGQEGYFYDGFEPKIEDFTNADIKAIEFIESNAYFNRFARSTDQEFDLPENIDKLFELYFLLDEDDKHSFLSSCSLFSQGIKLWAEHPSLSFAAMVSSLETLVILEDRSEEIERCKKCGQERYRVVKKFKDFLKKYSSSDPGFKKYASTIYKYRCKILHRGELFLGEVFPRRFASHEGFEDDQMRRSIISVCRICLVNWLSGRVQSLTSESTGRS